MAGDSLIAPAYATASAMSLTPTATKGCGLLTAVHYALNRNAPDNPCPERSRRPLFAFLLRFRRDQRGVAAIEFALLSPIFLMSLYASFELTRFIHLNQKVEKATFQIADIIAQSKTMSTTTLNNLMAATDDMMVPYGFRGLNSKVYITSVSRAANDVPRVKWQYCDGTAIGSSHIGTPGAAAVLPTGFTIAEKEDIIIAETFYSYAPVMKQPILASQTLYKSAIFRPRLGALDGFTSSCGS